MENQLICEERNHLTLYLGQRAAQMQLQCRASVDGACPRAFDSITTVSSHRQIPGGLHPRLE